MIDTTTNMPSESEQQTLLRSLKDGGGYGILLIVKQGSDVLFATSPVPELRGYEIVCASPERLYDIWRNGRLVTPAQTKQQVKRWIRDHTPVWLYDDTEVTEAQKILVKLWVEELLQLYPGVCVIG